MAVHCPQCGSSEHHRIVWDARAVTALIVNPFIWGFQIAEAWIILARGFHTGLWIRRKCLGCGERFLGPQRERPNFNECPRCEYDLTGNVSGRCPECGWKLTQRYRAHRKRTDSPKA